MSPNPISERFIGIEKANVLARLVEAAGTAERMADALDDLAMEYVPSSPTCLDLAEHLRRCADLIRQLEAAGDARAEAVRMSAVA
jgi:hypothetical protein